MNKEIKYTGHTATPADFECPDGDLSVVMDIWPENGALRPILNYSEVLYLQTGQRVIYVHESPSFPDEKHYIVFDENPQSPLAYLFWVKNNSSTAQPIGNAAYSGSQIIQVTGVGNTLVVLTTIGVFYYLWKNNAYSYLGNQIPELPISFGLKGEFVASPLYVDAPITLVMCAAEYIPDDKQKEITDFVMAKVVKFVSENATQMGKFMFPFFVRYAYRLFDGTLSHHSAPILMVPANNSNPIIKLALATAQTESYKLFGVRSTLDYAALGSSASSVLTNWRDIVKSIDIFVSAPIYTFVQDGTFKHISTSPASGYGLFKLGTSYTKDEYKTVGSTKGMDYYYMCHSLPNLLVYGKNGATGNYYLDLPEKDFKTSVPDAAQFYLLKSLNIDEITTTRTDVSIPNDYLQSLVNREVMTDDYQTHDKLIANYGYPYNNRLNLADMQRTLFSGFHPMSIIPYANGYLGLSGSAIDPTHETEVTSVKLYETIQEGGKTIVLSHNTNAIIYYRHLFAGFFYYYPNTNAEKMTLIYTGQEASDIRGADYELLKHTLLNGSYFFADSFSLPISSHTTPTITNNPTVQLINKIYTSEVNNPFLFLARNINTIGTGRIIAMASAARALAQGQFGDFPLYAFTSDGVWAMEVSKETGGFSAKQPIARDVLINRDAIAQLDSQVLFATDRGIMIISGAQTSCLTTAIDNKNDSVFSLSLLEPDSQNKFVSNILFGQGSSDNAFNLVSFRTFLSGCRILYDYRSQRIILFNPDQDQQHNPLYSYSYVYSIEMKQWAMMRSAIQSTVNSYPECFAMILNNSIPKLVDYSSRVANVSPKNQIIISRPIKLGEHNIQKTISSMIQRGNFASGHVKVMLFGSRDMINWFPIFSSNNHYLRGFSGTPYKYFRVVLKCSLTDSESIYGCSVEYQDKLTDIMR